MSKYREYWCQHCGSMPQFTADVFYDFFQGHSPMCPDPKCRRPIADWWSAMCGHIENYEQHPFQLFYAFPSLGYKDTVFVITMSPRQYTMVNLSDYGVPAAARILAVHYNALDGFLKPLEDSGLVLHPRTAALSRRPDGIYGIPPASSESFNRLQIPHRLKLYGAEVGPEMVGDTQVQVDVGWVEPDDAEGAATPLFLALEAFVMGRYAAALFSAQTAGEVKTEQLLMDGDTYYSQLRKLSLKADGVGVPHLRQDIWDLLDRLRIVRNKIAHEGRPPTPLTRSDVAEFLSATVFGVHFINLLIRKQ